MIDDEGRKPKPADKNLLANLHLQHRNNKRWIRAANAKVAAGAEKVRDDEAFVFRSLTSPLCYLTVCYLTVC